jgi:hypothetical protein
MKLLTYSSPPRSRRWSRRLVITAGVLLLFALGAGAPAWGAGAKGPHRLIFDPDATPSWTQEVHGAGDSYDAATDVALAKGGVTYVAGYIAIAPDVDASLMRLEDGVPAWPAPKTYDSPFHSVDVAIKMALGPGNTIYTAGLSTGANGMFDILVLKWSAAGAVQWARRYDGPAHGVDQATAVGVDSAGNVTAAGYCQGASQDWVVLSWSSTGAKRWTWRYDGSGHANDMAEDLVVAADGSVYVTGVTTAVTGQQSLTVRLSKTGAVLWKRAYAGPESAGAETITVAARPGGGVVVGGACQSATTGTDGMILAYTPAGARDVFALDTGPGGVTSQDFRDLAVASTGHVVAVGSSTSGGNQDCHVATYTKDGTIVAKLTVPGPAGDDYLTAVATDAYGGFYVTGAYHTLVNKQAVFTARGSTLTGGGGWWSVWAPAFVSEDNEPTAIAVRGTTACVVGQCNEGAGSDEDQLVLGYVY